MSIAALQSNPWAYPALETLHILGIALLLGNLVALEVRVWGGVATLPVLPLARLSLGLASIGGRIDSVGQPAPADQDAEPERSGHQHL